MFNLETLDKFKELTKEHPNCFQQIELIDGEIYFMHYGLFWCALREHNGKVYDYQDVSVPMDDLDTAYGKFDSFKEAVDHIIWTHAE
jgi:hypothetical protein